MLDEYINTGATPDQFTRNFLTSPNVFRHYIEVDVNGLGSLAAEFTVDLGSSQGIKTIFVMAWDWSNSDFGGYYSRLGESTVHISDEDSWMAASTQITAPFYATGFLQTTSDAEGQYLKIRRSAGTGGETAYNVVKALAYQAQDLLVVLADTVSITSDSAPASDADSAATNLILNPGTRMSNKIHEPITDIAGNTSSSIKSCYTTEQTSWPDTNTFILGFDLAASYFIHALLVIDNL